jgi:hypothetical protein
MLSDRTVAGRWLQASTGVSLACRSLCRFTFNWSCVGINVRHRLIALTAGTVLSACGRPDARATPAQRIPPADFSSPHRFATMAASLVFRSAVASLLFRLAAD